jgi:hypothetical protein
MERCNVAKYTRLLILSKILKKKIFGKVESCHPRHHDAALNFQAFSPVDDTSHSICN